LNPPPKAGIQHGKKRTFNDQAEPSCDGLSERLVVIQSRAEVVELANERLLQRWLTR
jgi:hypothetical protein